ncbi:hypothetical protein CapIbe_012729 [Capra ibex]
MAASRVASGWAGASNVEAPLPYQQPGAQRDGDVGHEQEQNAERERQRDSWQITSWMVTSYRTLLCSWKTLWTLISSKEHVGSCRYSPCVFSFLDLS